MNIPPFLFETPDGAQIAVHPDRVIHVVLRDEEHQSHLSFRIDAGNDVSLWSGGDNRAVVRAVMEDYTDHCAYWTRQWIASGRQPN